MDIRPAQSTDKHNIRRLILTVGINPTGLSWKRFLVAVTPDGALAGCVQIKPHTDGSRELASLAVEERYRGLGIARDLVTRVLEKTPRPVYLMCRKELGLLYNRFGFNAAQSGDMPTYFQRILRLSNAFMNGRILVMRLD